ncbi:acyltransferase domain-containing protein [uncultured Legionella sp.]|uniref:acyltransferase domain-containing protein n=1 Tax=uncultured Legionella sp. TaxID=210934 RepID=UPI002602AA39|nr:acyltransferase domain-containing protein [uncultured Legionella sp.]
MNLPIVFMYSGQGSQYYHMGQSLFAENPVFKNALEKTDLIYQEMTDDSIVKHLYNDPKNKSTPFTQTQWSHPAVFMIEYALTEVLLAKDIHPDKVLGASLGEFAAAVAAGVLSLESALFAVVKQAQTFAQCPSGGMLAIIHASELYHQESFLHEHSELASVNFDSHFVVAGTNENLQLIQKHLSQQSITFLLLPVSHAFHSTLIDLAKAPFLERIKDLNIQPPKIEFTSCKNARSSASFTHEHFWELARQPILFQKTIQELEKKEPAIYIDVGPSGTLATFVKYNLSAESQSIPVPFITPFGNDAKNLEKLEQTVQNK